MNTRRRRPLIRATGVLVGLLFAVAPSSISAADKTVSIVDFAFQPTSVTITAGSTVTWTNKAGQAHTVTADDGSFDSGSLAPNDAFANVFDTAGSVTYHCAIHPRMTGTVVVKAAAATPSPSGSPESTPPPGTLPPGFSPGGPSVAPASVVGTPPPAATPTPSGTTQDQAGSLVAVALVVVVAALIGALLLARRARVRRR